MTASQPNADGSTEVAHSPRVDGLHGLPETQRRVAIRRLAAVGREMIETMSITDATSAICRGVAATSFWPIDDWASFG